MWGAFLISALETCQGLRVSNQSRGLRRVTVRGRATRLLVPVRRVENYSSTRGEYLVLSKRPLEHFPPFRLTLHFHLQREALGVCRIIIRPAFSFACVRGKGYFQLTPSCKPGMVLKSNRTPPTSRASHFHPRFSGPRDHSGIFCLHLSCLRLAKVSWASKPFDCSFLRCEFGTQIPAEHLPGTDII